jgi:hypothetical protein
MDAPRAAVAVLLVLASAPLVGAGCGDDSGSAAQQLQWLDTPTVIVPPVLKSDRILSGDVRNDSGDDLRIEASKVRVYDNRGRRLNASATFAAGYLHSLYPPTRGPESLPDSELERLGRIATIESGQTTQMTVSWREPAGPRHAARIDYGPGSLLIPPEAVNRRDREF